VTREKHREAVLSVWLSTSSTRKIASLDTIFEPCVGCATIAGGRLSYVWMSLDGDSYPHFDLPRPNSGAFLLCLTRMYRPGRNAPRRW